MTSLNICVSSHGETRNLKFGQPGNLIQRVLLGTRPSQEVLISLQHIHMTQTNFFISSHRGYCYQILAVKQLDRSPLGTSYPLGVVTSLYLQLKRGHRGYVHPLNTLVTINFLLQIFCDNKFCMKDNCSCGSWCACWLLYLYMKQAN